MVVHGFVSTVWGAEGRRSVAWEGCDSYDGFGESDGSTEEPEFSAGGGRVC
jgi:hypothetical protein